MAFGFNKGCLQCLAKPSYENSKRIGMSTMGGEFFGKKHDGTKARLYERTTTRLHERTMAQAEVHPYNMKQVYCSGDCNLEAWFVLERTVVVTGLLSCTTQFRRKDFVL